MLQPLDPMTFFAQGLQQIDDQFAYLANIATAAGSTRGDSGLITPVVMLPGSSATEWLLPEGATGKVLVVDHGFVQAEDQYTVDYVARTVTLAYTPAMPYAVSAMWSPSKGGITAPVPLSNATALGVEYWDLPVTAGVNVLVFERGRVLRRDEYTVDYENRVVRLSFAPVGPTYDVMASWAQGGPGIIPPELVPPVSLAPGNRDFTLPPYRGESLLVLDHGLVLNASDYTISPTGVLTLGYNPALPLNIAVSWGQTMSGMYLFDENPVPTPDGINTVFTLGQEPIVDTIRLWAELPNGTLVTYAEGVDFTVTGRRLDFTAAPPDETVLHCSYSTVIMLQPLTVSRVNGMLGLHYNDSGVGTPTGADALVGTDPAGKLPGAIMPSLLGYGALPYNHSWLGTGQAYEQIPTFAPDGRLTNINLPAQPTLGAAVTSVVTIKGTELDTNTLDREVTLNGDGTLAQIQFKSGATVVKQSTYAYHASGLVNTIVTVAGGVTVTKTFTYTGDNWTGVTTVVS